MKDNKLLNLRATWVVAIAVIFSRCLGLFREILFNTLFGTYTIGIFLIAFRMTNLLRDLFAEGALSISFITVFSKKIAIEGEESAWDLASKMMTLLTVLMSLVCLLGIMLAKKTMIAMAPGFSTADSDAAVLLTQIMYPFILLVSLAALAMGILNSKNVFGVPALASSFFNMGSIVGGTLCGWLIDPGFGEKALSGLAVGTLLGGFLQLVVQIPSLRRVGFRFRPNFHWYDSGVRQIMVLTIPGMIAASAVQINIFINSSFASLIGNRAVTWLNSAFRLVQFPIGIFAIAVATITIPVISRIATKNNPSEVGKTLGASMRLIVFLTMPAAVGLWVFAKPIICLIYEHGKFNSHDSTQTALALQFYAIGLLGYSCVKILVPGFYAINKKWVPMFVSCLTIVTNIFLNYFLIVILTMGHCGIAFSTAISATINFVMLYIIMNHSHYLQTKLLLRNSVYCGLASALMGIVCYQFVIHFDDLIYHESFLIRSCFLAVIMCFASMIYLFTCLLLRVDEAENIFSGLKKLYLKDKVINPS